MKTYKYWTMILAIGAAMAAPLAGCSSDDVETNKGGKSKNTDDKDGDDDGKGGSGGEDNTDGEGGDGGDDNTDGEGGNGGEGGGGDQTSCSGQFTGNATCDDCINAQCCTQKEACADGTACFTLLACISQSCSTAADLTACVQANCPEAATQEAVDAYNALGTCLCQDSCGTECAGACGG